MLFIKFDNYSSNSIFNVNKAYIVAFGRSISTAVSSSSIKTTSKINQTISNTDSNRIPIQEHSRYNLSLYQTTIFPYEHTHRLSSVTKAVLSFRFRPIEFSKKRSLLFFLALELLTSQKAIASLSSRNRQS